MVRRKKLFIILPTEKSPVSTVIADGESVLEGMTNHTAEFPEPPVTMVAFAAALNLLKDSVVPESEKNTTTTNLMQKRKVDFINNQLLPNSNYVLLVANGDRYIAGLSGYRLSKEEVTPVEPSEFQAVSMGVGPIVGSTIVRILERAGCIFFIVKHKVGDDYIMHNAYNTLTFTVTDLPSGTNILQIIGKKGEYTSPPVELVVRAL